MSQNRVGRSAARAGGVDVRPRKTDTRETPRSAAPPRQRAGRAPAGGGRQAQAATGRTRGDDARKYDYRYDARRTTRSGYVVGGAGTPIGVAAPPVTLTGLGVVLALLAASSLGALLDLFLVGGPDWALTALYVASCVYTARRVRRADWFTALVAPPLAFAGAVILLAYLMPDSGHGVLGVAAGTFEILTAKAKALYLGASLTAVVLLVRRVKERGKKRGNGRGTRR